MSKRFVISMWDREYGCIEAAEAAGWYARMYADTREEAEAIEYAMLRCNEALTTVEMESCIVDTKPAKPRIRVEQETGGIHVLRFPATDDPTWLWFVLWHDRETIAGVDFSMRETPDMLRDWMHATGRA